MMGRQNEEQYVSFNSNVKDVEVRASGKIGYTPCTIPLRQSKNHAITVVKEGYDTQTTILKSGFSGAGFAHSTASNLVTWGWWTWGIGLVIGWAIDACTGAMKNLKEEAIHFEMRESEV